MRHNRGFWLSLLLTGALLFPHLLAAQLPPASQILTVSPKLLHSEPLVPIAGAGQEASPATLEDWHRFVAESKTQWGGYLDRRSGQIAAISGGGLAWLDRDQKPDLERLEKLVRELLSRYPALLGVDPASLRLDRGRSAELAPQIWAADFDVLTDGDVPIEGTRAVFRVNHGRLIDFGTENLPTPGSKAPQAVLDRKAAWAVVERYLATAAKKSTATGKHPALGKAGSEKFLDEGSLHVLPVNLDVDERRNFKPGQGRGLARVWQFVFQREGVIGTFRARVDAATGELLAFEDTNRYAQATGGVASDTAAGTEVLRPMPFADIGGGLFTNSAGLYTFGGSPLSSTLNGQYVNIHDAACGAISQTTNVAGDLLFGSAAGSNCTTPGNGGAGNTRSARTSFYTLNRGKEIARGWFPGTPFFSAQVTANVNLTGTCNGFWNGSTVQLYQAVAGSCGASGEEPGFILHEFGHAIDANDGNGSTEGATGESYGDTNAAMVLHNSCVGAGFWTSNCTGYGDACTSCTGLRDVDWAHHTSNTAHTVDNFARVHCNIPDYPGPCGTSAHCESYIPSEAVWDFVNRDLPNPGTGAAWAVGERLFYTSRSTATTSFSCTTSSTPWTSNGCNTGSLWRVFRTLDDDDGDLSNGTPHGAALFAAFNRHGIACAGDPGSSTTHVDCTPPPAPVLTAAGGTNQVALSWTSSGAGMVYDVGRNELSCNAAFAPIPAATATSMTSFNDPAVANGTTYYYRVVAYPSGNPACSSPPSNCQPANLAGADPSIRPWGAAQNPQTPPLWQTPDIWVDNDADGTPNESGEPTRGIPDNQLFARVTNTGNVATGPYRVTFSAKPYTTSASAPAVVIDHVDEAGPLAPGAALASHVTWDLTDTWVQANFASMFWTADHFCVQVAIGAAGSPLTDVDLTNNSAQNNFVNIPMAGGGVAKAQFFIYNHLERAAVASLKGLVRAPGWRVRFEGIETPTRIVLKPRQWMAVTVVATAASAKASKPKAGAPILVEVSQQLDGKTVGGLTFAIQPPDFDRGLKKPVKRPVKK